MKKSEAIDLIIKNYKRDKEFSSRLARYNFSIMLLSHVGMKKIVEDLNKKKDAEVIRILETILGKNLNESVNTYKKIQEKKPADHLPIWLCWWTGEKNAPALVKQCIQSIRKNAGNHPVIMVTKDNVSDFLDIPSFITEKVDKGVMCLANFSDYLRFSLLEKYGGMWMDVTIFCSQPIPESSFEAPLFSGRLPKKEGDYISNYEWTSFCFAGQAHHPLFCFFKNCFETYWSNSNKAIDYLFVDYLIHLGRKYIPIVETDMQQIPITNTHRFELQKAMRAGVVGTKFCDYLFDDTWLNKLSWHEDYPKVNSEGKETVFSYFLKLEFSV